MALTSTSAGERIRGHRANVKREIVHQGSLKHPFIVGLKEVGPAQSWTGVGPHASLPLFALWAIHSSVSSWGKQDLTHRAGQAWARMLHFCVHALGR